MNACAAASRCPADTSDSCRRDARARPGGHGGARRSVAARGVPRAECSSSRTGRLLGVMEPRLTEHRPTWLCPDAASRERLLDMDERLRRPRAAALGLLGFGVVVGDPVPRVGAARAAGAARSLALLGRAGSPGVPSAPEYGLAVSWAFTQVVIATAVGLTGGPESYVLSWLVVPLVTLPGALRRARRRGRRGLHRAAGRGRRLRRSRDAAAPTGVRHGATLLMLAGVAILSSALMRSDLEHRTEAVVDDLTGMLNRRALEQRLEELRRAGGGRRPADRGHRRRHRSLQARQRRARPRARRRRARRGRVPAALTAARVRPRVPRRRRGVPRAAARGGRRRSPHARRRAA